MESFLRSVSSTGILLLIGTLPRAARAMPPNYFLQPATNLGSVVNSSFGDFTPELSRDGRASLLLLRGLAG